MAKRILVIDDEADVLQIVRAVLNTKGHQVITANGGEEGVSEAKQERPDLIICDLMMPRVSGLEVLKRIRADESLRGVPVIVLSALGDDEQRPPEFWIRTLNVDDYLQKPFDPLDLLGRVEFIFRRSSYVSSGGPVRLEDEEAAPATMGPDPDNETVVPVDVRSAEPDDVVTAFVESWNRQDFATEFHCLAEDMTGQMNLHDYVARRRQTYMEEKGQSRRQKVLEIIEKKVSVNVSRVVIDRQDTVNGNTKIRREAYTLKKTNNGWKILACRTA